MTVKREYQCDLCLSLIYNQVEGIGVYWSASVRDGYMAFKAVSETEHHLCNNCVAGIARNAHLVKFSKNEDEAA